MNPHGLDHVIVWLWGVAVLILVLGWAINIYGVLTEEPIDIGDLQEKERSKRAKTFQERVDEKVERFQNANKPK